MAWKVAIGAAHSGDGVPKPVMLDMQRKTEQGSGAWARAGALRPRPKAAASANVVAMVRSFMMDTSLAVAEMTCLSLTPCDKLGSARQTRHRLRQCRLGHLIFRLRQNDGGEGTMRMARGVRTRHGRGAAEHTCTVASPALYRDG